jgi:predicted permease
MFWRRRKEREQDLERELRSHLESEAAEQQESGLSPEEARAASRRALGNATLVREDTRAEWGWGAIERLTQDLRYAIRLLRKSPAFTVTAVVSLAIGIGMNTAMFTLLDAILLESLPVASPEELVLMAERTGARLSFSLSSPAFRGLAANGALTGLAAFRPWRFRTQIHGETQFANGLLVSGSYFSLLGLKPFIGRTLTPADDGAAGTGAVAVLSYDYWQRAFGGNPSVIGQTIELQGYPFSVVGVAAPGFYGLEPGKEVDITVPLATQPIIMPGSPLLNSENARWLRLIGRRKPNLPLAQAQASLRVTWGQMQAAPAGGRVASESQLDVLPGGQGLYDLRREFELPLRVLMGAVALVLLVACANLASLLLARATARRQEISLRISLGATQSRLLLQLLTESMLLSAIGGICGTAIAYWAGRVLVELMSRGRTPIVLDLSLHTRTLMFAVVVTLLTGLLFGIAPAFRTANAARLHGLRVVAGGPRRWTAALIVAQVSLCLVVLACAGLLLGSLERLRNVDAGFRKDHVLLMSIRPPSSGYDRPQTAQLYLELQRRFSALPGVKSVTLSMDTPLGGVSYTAAVSLAGLSGPRSDQMQASMNCVGPQFFETMGIPMLAGRELNVRDDERRPPVAVIGESVAHGLFPNRNPLGQRIEMGQISMEIVGVAKDVRYQSLREPVQPMIYRPYLQTPDFLEELFFGIRTVDDPDRIVNLVRRELHNAAPDVPVFTLGTLEERVDATLVRERMASALSAWFGGFALLLAAVGLYGRLAYAVVERTREIGIRVALGAARTTVMWAILRQVLILALSGIAIGLPFAMAFAQAIRSLLFGLAPFDPSTLATVAIMILGVSAFAGYIPARRASRVDPMVALRYE